MQGNVEVLIRLIIPAILLILWALNNLFNREAQNAAQARARATPLGPRPGGPNPSARERQAAPPPARYQAPNDEILIIRSDSLRPPARNTAPPRRPNPGRARPGPAPAARKPEPPPKVREQLGGRIESDMGQTVAKSMDVRPLSEHIADGMTSTDTTAPVGATKGVTVTAPTTAADLLVTFGSKARIREAFLLNELLQPPLALRRKSRSSGPPDHL